jgi:hypothetical protein
LSDGDAVDLDGDGITDGVALDTDGDGLVDSVAIGITGYFWGPEGLSKDFLKSVEEEFSVGHAA